VLHGIDGVSGNDTLKGAAGADTCEADAGDIVEGCE
jgi:Ca2+-binding RTX toxin-like protein